MTTRTELIEGTSKEILETIKAREAAEWELLMMAPASSKVENLPNPGHSFPYVTETIVTGYWCTWETFDDVSHPAFLTSELQAFLGAAQTYWSLPSAGSADALRTACSKILATGLDYPAEDWDQV